MPDLSAARRLVKSAPELWAEISDPAALARHLGEFGEIKITRLEPEHTVAWEGEVTSGLARIESSGWGTKVVLTAEVPEPEVPEPAEPEPAAVEPAAVEPEPPATPEPESEPSRPDLGSLSDPGAGLLVEEPPAAAEASTPEDGDFMPDGDRRSLLARLFGVGWTKRLEPAAEVTPDPAPDPPEAEPPIWTYDTMPFEPIFDDLAPQATETTEPEPAPPEPARPELAAVERTAVEPEPEPEPEAVAEEEPTPSSLDPEWVRAVLDQTLDALGAAHHRPFSRH